MTRVLCYSWSERTARVAAAVAAELAVEMDRIVAPRVRAGGLWGMLVWGRAARAGADTPVEVPPVDWPRFGALVLAAPVWAGRVAVPMASFLRAHPALPPRLGLVMTGADPRRPAGAFADFARLAGREPLATLYVARARVERGDFAPDIAEFCAALAAGP
ncbi:MAG: hypothetical protein GC146_02655 [Limimaricola sp.]|uniref:hypothetical protein n=1 Tax=Limimaricola sp. TaxID=2211665 RepID=UPI001E0B5BCA|nr:hypothetical protein [Limimaricola sp.]MBI1416100.1 hypothetical protein [Limimaricola sp.]